MVVNFAPFLTGRPFVAMEKTFHHKYSTVSKQVSAWLPKHDPRVPNSPTGQVLEAGPGWPVLVMAMTGPD